VIAAIRPLPASLAAGLSIVDSTAAATLAVTILGGADFHH
jgi:hypothetical protein